MMKFKLTYKRIFIVAMLLLFSGNAVFTLYKSLYDIPEQLRDLKKQRTSYVIVQGDNTQVIKNFPPALQSEKILKDYVLIQSYQYALKDVEWDSILNLKPKELKINQNDDTVHLYFYKRIFHLETLLYIFYNSFIWTLSVIIMMGFFSLVLFFIIYILIKLKQFINEYQLKKLNYLKEMN